MSVLAAAAPERASRGALTALREARGQQSLRLPPRDPCQCARCGGAALAWPQAPLETRGEVAAAAVSGRAATQIVAKAVMTEAGVLSYVALGIVVVVAAEETVSETREIATAFGTVGTLTGGAGGKTEGR